MAAKFIQILEVRKALCQPVPVWPYTDRRHTLRIII